MPFDLSSMLGAFGRSMAYPQAQTPQTNKYMQNLPYYFGSGPTGKDAINAEPYYIPPATDNPQSYMQLLSTNGGMQSGMSTSNAPISLLGPSAETPQTDLGVAGAGVGAASPYDYGSSSNAYPDQPMDPYGYQQQPSGGQGSRFGDFAGSFLYGMGAALASNRPGAGVPAMQEFAQRAERKKLIKQKEAANQRAVDAGVKRLEALGRPDLASLGRAGTVDIGTLLKMAMEPDANQTPYTDVAKIQRDIERGYITQEQGDALIAQNMQPSADSYGLDIVPLVDADGVQHFGQLAKGGGMLIDGVMHNTLPAGMRYVARPQPFKTQDTPTTVETFDPNSGQYTDTRLQKDLAGAEKQKTLGGATGDSLVEYNAMASKMPQLESTVKELDSLGGAMTYTIAGKIYDSGRRQLGVEPREAATARAEYMAKVDNQVLPLLRETFGAQFTVEEGKSLRATLGAPDLSPQEKSAVLQAFIIQKRRNIEAKAEEARMNASGQIPGADAAKQRRRKYNPATGQIE